MLVSTVETKVQVACLKCGAEDSATIEGNAERKAIECLQLKEWTIVKVREGAASVFCPDCNKEQREAQAELKRIKDSQETEEKAIRARLAEMAESRKGAKRKLKQILSASDTLPELEPSDVEPSDVEPVSSE